MKHLFLSLLFLSSFFQLSYGDTIYIRYSDSHPVFETSAKQLYERIQLLIPENKDNALQDSPVKKKVVIIDENQKPVLKKTDLVINFATEQLLPNSYHNQNILSFISINDYKTLSSETKKQVLASVMIEQPIDRSIKLAKNLIKNNYKNKVLLCLSENVQSDEIKHIVKKYPDLVEVVVVQKSQSPVKIIQKYLDKTAAIVAVRDTHVWSKKNARLMLHQAYKNGIPIVGYSKSFIKSGAMLSVFSSAESIVDSLYNLVFYVMEKKFQLENISQSTEKVIYPDPDYGVNRNIVKALKFDLDKIFAVEENQ